ncbi:hypothetical protein, partial [Escherichia coli]
MQAYRHEKDQVSAPGWEARHIETGAKASQGGKMSHSDSHADNNQAWQARREAAVVNGVGT